MPKQTNLTAVIVTRNEENKLPGCLTSLDFVDRILLVDDFSKDATADIARKAGAAVVKRRLDNFSTQRNFALGKVETEWVLLIDVDERVPAALREEISTAIAKDEYDGLYFPRKNIIFGKWIAHTGWYPDYQLHLFKTKKGKYAGDVHEQVEVEGKVGYLKSALEHRNYETVSQYLNKLDRYTGLSARSLADSGIAPSLSRFIRRPVSEFIRRYYREKGYLDGVHGLVLSLLQAFSEFVVEAKLWELNRFQPDKLSSDELDREINNSLKETGYWQANSALERLGSGAKAAPAQKLKLKIKRKLSRL